MAVREQQHQQAHHHADGRECGPRGEPGSQRSRWKRDIHQKREACVKSHRFGGHQSDCSRAENPASPVAWDAPDKDPSERYVGDSESDDRVSAQRLALEPAV